MANAAQFDNWQVLYLLALVVVELGHLRFRLEEDSVAAESVVLLADLIPAGCFGRLP